MFKTYLLLIGAIFFEVAGTMLLPVSQNFTKPIPTTALSIFYLCAFYLLTFVVNKNVGTSFVKFCDTGRSIVPATSKKIAPIKNK